MAALDFDVVVDGSRANRISGDLDLTDAESVWLEAYEYAQKLSAVSGRLVEILHGDEVVYRFRPVELKPVQLALF